MFRPFEKVTEEHHTLFWTEFFGLLVAFLTFWTGLFFFQEVAQDPEIQMVLTVQLLTVNAIILLLGIRWFFILKLMDLTDMVDTKRLQGFEDEDLVFERAFTSCLLRCFPEWQYVKNLWARRAWQRTIKEQILRRRHVAAFSTQSNTKSNTKDKKRRFSLGNTEDMYDHAQLALGLQVQKKQTPTNKKIKAKRRSSAKLKKMVALHKNTTEHNVGTMYASIRMKQILARTRGKSQRRVQRQSGSILAASALKKSAMRSRFKTKQHAIKIVNSTIEDHIESTDKRRSGMLMDQVDARIRLARRLHTRNSQKLQEKMELEQEGGDTLIVPLANGGLVRSTSRKMRRRSQILIAPPLMGQQIPQKMQEDASKKWEMAQESQRKNSDGLISAGKVSAGKVSAGKVSAGKVSADEGAGGVPVKKVSRQAPTAAGADIPAVQQQIHPPALAPAPFVKPSTQAAVSPIMRAIRNQVATKLAKINLSKLFAKLDAEGSGSIDQKGFNRILKSVGKNLRNKETQAQVWLDVTNGNMRKTELTLQDLKAWLAKCGDQKTYSPTI